MSSSFWDWGNPCSQRTQVPLCTPCKDRHFPAARNKSSQQTTSPSAFQMLAVRRTLLLSNKVPFQKHTKTACTSETVWAGIRGALTRSNRLLLLEKEKFEKKIEWDIDGDTDVTEAWHRSARPCNWILFLFCGFQRMLQQWVCTGEAYTAWKRSLGRSIEGTDVEPKFEIH